MEHVLGEDPASTEAETHGTGRQAINRLSRENVVLKVLFGEKIGGVARELGQQAHVSDRSLWGAFSFAIELQGGNHVLASWGQDTPPPSLSGQFAYPYRRKSIVEE